MGGRVDALNSHSHALHLCSEHAAIGPLPDDDAFRNLKRYRP